MNYKYQNLDALRWIAAFSVGVGHAFLCFNVNRRLPEAAHFYGTMVFNGAYAVDLFFVLSGFVLINATSELSLETYIGFLSRRFIRIYPAAWMSLALSGVAIAIVHVIPRYGVPWVSPWAEWLLEIPPITIPSILEQSVLYKNNMNPILWTIAIEIVASVVYPVIIYILRKWRAAFLLLFFPVSVILSFYIRGTLDVSSAYHFLYMFMAGAALTLLKPAHSNRWGAYLIGVGIALMLWSRWFGQDHGFYEDVISTISAASIIGSIAFSCPQSLQRLLGTSRFVLLGRASYSYYLINPAILFTIARCYPVLGIPAPSSPLLYVAYSLSFGAVAAAITVPLANVSAASVEKLSIRIGRNAERRVIASLRRYRAVVSAKVLSEPPV